MIFWTSTGWMWPLLEGALCVPAFSHSWGWEGRRGVQWVCTLKKTSHVFSVIFGCCCWNKQNIFNAKQTSIKWMHINWKYKAPLKTKQLQQNSRVVSSSYTFNSIKPGDVDPIKQWVSFPRHQLSSVCAPCDCRDAGIMSPSTYMAPTIGIFYVVHPKTHKWFIRVSKAQDKDHLNCSR